jgi:hypothetical protein
MPFIWRRIRFAYLSINPALRVAAMLYTIVAAIVLALQKVFPHPYDQYRIRGFLPHWSWQDWAIVWLVLLVISAVEALYQYEKPENATHIHDAHRKSRSPEGR